MYSNIFILEYNKFGRFSFNIINWCLIFCALNEIIIWMWFYTINKVQFFTWSIPYSWCLIWEIILWLSNTVSAVLNQISSLHWWCHYISLSLYFSEFMLCKNYSWFLINPTLLLDHFSSVFFFPVSNLQLSLGLCIFVCSLFTFFLPLLSFMKY